MATHPRNKPPAPPPPFAPAPSPPPARPSGVRVIVNHRPEPPPLPRPPEPELPQGPRVIIFPPNQSRKDRDAFLAELEGRYGDLIRSEIARRGDVAPGSRDDVRQVVLLVLCRHFDKATKAGRAALPEHPGAFLRTVVDNAVLNHGTKKKRRPRFDTDAEIDEAAESAPDPEQAVIQVELQEKLARYHRHLTKEERQVLHAREELGLSFEVIAEQLGRPRTTVFRQHAEALAKLRDQAAASERAAARRRGG